MQKLIWPTPEEDAAINRGIAADPDNPELTDEFFRNAKPSHEIPELAGLLQAERDDALLHVDRDVIARLSATGGD